MIYLALLALGVGIGVPIAAMGCGIGQGIAINGALQGMARQPEASGTIQTGMIIGLAFIESLTIYALLIFFMLKGFLPDVHVAADLTALTSLIGK